MKHMSGLLSHIEHHMRLEKEAGHAISFPASYDHLHQHNIGPKKGEWVDEDSRELSGVFHAVYDNVASQATQAVQPPPDLPTLIELFAEAAGGLRKGRVQGIGSFSDVVKTMKRGSQAVSHSPMEQMWTEMEAKFKKEMAKQKREFKMREKKRNKGLAEILTNRDHVVLSASEIEAELSSILDDELELDYDDDYPLTVD